MEKKAEYKNIEYFLLACVILQVSVIFFINFFKLENFLNYDSTVPMAHAIQMWNQKKIFIDYWKYQTTTELDLFLPLVAVLYGVTHNILFSYGAVNNIYICIFIFITNKICRSTNVNKIEKYVFFLLVFTPYVYDQLGYFTMLFSGPAFYIVRILSMLLMVAICIDFSKGKYFRQQWKEILLLLILCFKSGISTGLYVALCCFLPIIIYYIFISLNSEKVKKDYVRQIVFGFIGILFILIGNLYSKIRGFSSTSSDMVLTNIEKFSDNFKSFILSFFDLFGGIPYYDNVKVISISGIVFLLKFALVVFIFISLYVNIKCTFKNKKEENKKDILGICISIFLVNSCVLIFSYTKYGAAYFENRYDIVFMIPMLMLCGWMISWLIKKARVRFINYLIVAAFLGSLLLVNIFEFRNIIKLERNEQSVGLKKILENEEYDVCILYGEELVISSRILRVYLDEKNVISAIPNGERVWFYGWGASTVCNDITEQGDKVALVIREEQFLELQDYYKHNANLIASLDGLNVYEVDARFDFSTELPNVDNNIDFPYTYGYKFSKNSVINDFGELEVHDVVNSVLTSPVINGCDGKFDFILSYQNIGETVVLGEFSVYVNDQKYSAEMKGNENAVILSNISIKKEDRVQYKVNSYVDNFTIKNIEVINNKETEKKR